MFIMLIIGLIANLYFGIVTYPNNYKTFNSLENLSNKYSLPHNIESFSLNNTRQNIFFTSYQSTTNEYLYDVQINKLNIKTKKLDSSVVVKKAYLLSNDFFVDSQDNVYVIVKPEKNSEYIYIYSNNLQLLNQVPVIYKPDKIEQFVQSGVKTALKLTASIEHESINFYILKNLKGEHIAILGNYLDTPIPFSNVDFMSNFVLSYQKPKNFEGKDYYQKIFYDNNKMVEITHSCYFGSFSSFGCSNDKVSIKDNDSINITLTNVQIISPNGSKLFDYQERVLLKINNQLYLISPN